MNSIQPPLRLVWAAIRGLALLVVPPLAAASLPTPGDVLAMMEKVADWQLAHPAGHRTDSWIYGTFYAGLMALSEVSPSRRFDDAMRRQAEANHWKLGPVIYLADDHCVGQAYAELALRHHDSRMIAPMREQFDAILARPKDDNLIRDEGPGPAKNPDHGDKWSWCDTLFVAPPAWVRLSAVTGDLRYRDFAVEKWWRTSDVLYDREEHLYYRDTRYFTKREPNGAKVFWARGNGWVLAGLARILPFLPGDHPVRPRFERQFREMAERVLALQQPDGLWRAGLLDPVAYTQPESSGSAFFCFAFAWGVNHRLLDATRFTPAIERAWAALVGCVEADGCLIHVQPIGASPKNFPPGSTEPHGIGACLLAGCEVYRLTTGNTTSKPRGID